MNIVAVCSKDTPNEAKFADGVTCAVDHKREVEDDDEHEDEYD
ncbi:MAG TPA: hypothetical protein VE860_24730 [Chthoniobacterales bacterium]|nr:hypothetical protein [Chthoniobacterales bacterium]